MNPIANIKAVLPKYKDRALLLFDEFGEYKYCGWGNKRLELVTSPLANPYTTKANARRSRIYVPTRDEAVEAYRHWLWKQIKESNLTIMHELSQITPDMTLVCWCAPARCHCEVIAQAANWIRQQDKLSWKMMRAGFKISYEPSNGEWEAYWDFHNGGDGFVTVTIDRAGKWWLAMRTDDYGNPYPEERYPTSIHFISKWVELILASPKEVLHDYRKHIFEHTKEARAYEARM